uniref:Fe2OG dioxygenase domain-containing protein n=1 Tax=Haptolina ericina TaxID=156174 RepID=A0A7S3AQL7_9EUKA
MPAQPASLQPAVATYWSAAEKVLRILMRLSALALGLPADFFTPYFAAPKCNLRLAYYPELSASDTPSLPAGAIRYGAHTDYTGFTILYPDPVVGGLQVQQPSGEWEQVDAVPGALFVNAGDLISVWTNERWRSPPHRVVNPPEPLPGEKAPARLSMVFFTGPADDTVVEALPGCHGPGRPKRFSPISAREHLMAKLAATSTK